jgi:heme oxygenase (biliverdin-IX-beta and delta-forming)
MTTSSGRKHAGLGPASDQPPVPEPTFAERARTLVYLGRVGSLSTLSRKQPGFPFGSVMPYGLDDHGRPIFLMSSMAMHTQNLQADARASLLVTQEDNDGEPLGASRVKGFSLIRSATRSCSNSTTTGHVYLHRLCERSRAPATSS